MKQTFTASITKDGWWYVPQCIEINIASQGETVIEALSNLREDVELHLKPPVATVVPARR